MSSQREQLWEVRFRVKTPPGSQPLNLRETCEQAGFRFIRAPNVFSWCIDAGGREHAIVAVRTFVQTRLNGVCEVAIESVRPAPNRPSPGRLTALRPNLEDGPSGLDRLRGIGTKTDSNTFGLRLRSDGLCESSCSQADRGGEIE